MLSTLRSCFALICFMLLVAPAWGQAERVLQIGYYDFPPSIYTDQSGEAQGPLVDLMRRMLDRSGYQYRFKKLPIARLYNQLRDGGVDLWAGAPDKQELSGYVVNGQQQLAVVALNLYYLPQTPAPTLPEDLKGQVMIVLNGFSYWPKTHDLLLEPKHGIIQLRTNNRLAAVELLLRKRGDYLLDYHIPAKAAFETIGVQSLPYVPVERLPIVLVGSNKTPNIEHIIASLEQTYLNLVATGEDVALPE